MVSRWLVKSFMVDRWGWYGGPPCPGLRDTVDKGAVMVLTLGAGQAQGLPTSMQFIPHFRGFLSQAPTLLGV